MKLNEPLTEREKNVVALLLQGKSNKQIAQELGVTTRTVEFHNSHIYKKLGVSSRAEALIKLSENHLRITTDKTEGTSFRESTVEKVRETTENGGKPIISTRRITMKKLLPYILLAIVSISCLGLLVFNLVYRVGQSGISDQQIGTVQVTSVPTKFMPAQANNPTEVLSTPPNTPTPTSLTKITPPTTMIRPEMGALPETEILPLTETQTPAVSPATYCAQLAEQHQSAEGFQTYCDADYGFALDYPKGWNVSHYMSSPDDPASPLTIRRGQMFADNGMSNLIRVDTYHLYGDMSLAERVHQYFSYSEREFAEKEYPSFSIGGQRAYAIINRWHQDISAVTLFFQHGTYYTAIELKAPSRSALDTNWKIAASLQVPGVSPDQNVIPDDLIEDSYQLLRWVDE